MKSPVEDDIVPRDFPKTLPEKFVGNYLTSKFLANQIKKLPEWDNARDSLNRTLYLSKLELFASEKRLATKKHLRKKIRKYFDAELKKLEANEKVLQMSFKKMNEFIKTNQDKKERAEQKLIQEKELQVSRTEDIENLTCNIHYLMEIKAKMEEKTKEYRVYDDYMQGVVKSAPVFKTSNEIFERYISLSSAKNQLGEKLEHELTAFENAKSDLAKVLGENSLKLMGLNNQVTELDNRYNRARNKVLLWESQVSRIHTVSLQLISEYNNAQNSCYNIYKNMCRRKGVKPVFGNTQNEDHLLFIKRTFNELNKILRKCRKGHKSPVKETISKK